MNWVLFLHFYQPSGQKNDLLEKIVNQSYRPILSLLRKFPGAKLNINLNGCLTEQLNFFYQDVIDEIRDLVELGQIELVGSAKHHAFLPLIPEKEISRQIELGMKTNRDYLGNAYNPQGFFPTELAYAPRIYRSVVRNKFKYLLVDEISVAGKFGALDWENCFQIENNLNEVKVVPVNRYWSNQLRSNHEFYIDDFFWFIKEAFSDQRVTLITANDAEVFGHHYDNRLKVLEKAFKDSEIKLLTISEYLSASHERRIESVKLLPGTWETVEEDINFKDVSKQLPYPLWYNPENEVQLKQWKLAWLAISNMAYFLQPKNDVGWTWHASRDHLDKGLSSCYWWWASCRPWWNPDMICEGASHLIKSVRSSKAGLKKKLMAEKLYAELTELVWGWHWSGESQKRIDVFEKKAGHGLFWVRTEPIGW